MTTPTDKETVERLADQLDRTPLYESHGEETDLTEEAANTLRALQQRITELEQERQWQPIETAPKGVERNGKKAMSWMILAIPDDEGGFHTVDGMRVGDDFFAALTYHCGGPFDGKQFCLKETQVHPTKWQPLPPPPTEDV